MQGEGGTEGEGPDERVGDEAAAGAGGRIGLALSGGGSRAIAFHLGCLRAMRDCGVLDRVAAISSVSGGSVLAALYCGTPGDFNDFERRTRAMLRRGMVRPAIGVALTTLEAPRAVATWAVLALDRSAALLARLGVWKIGRAHV